MASWVDSLLHTLMQVLHYLVKIKKQTNKHQRTKQHKRKKRMGPGVPLTNFKSWFSKFNLQCL